MSNLLSLILFGAAGVGMVLVVVQLLALRGHLRAPAPPAGSAPPISVLKPLCGLDDGLLDNIASFAAQPYPRFEVLLGVRDQRDGAYPLACAAAARWPDRVRVVLQEGAPGLNPKVNQLISLARAARFDVLVVSDSNIRVGSDYLAEIAAHLDDLEVGLVTHLLAGSGEERMGSVLDNLHLLSYVGPGVITAKRVAGKDIVIGKSMALRRADLEAIGGFSAVKDVLAEDYVMGGLISSILGKRVAVARRPVVNHSRDRSVRDFVDRYQRWSVMHRQAVSPFTYGAQALLNPMPLAFAGLAAAPSAGAAAVFAGLYGLKVVLDNSSARRLRARGFGARALVAVPLKDFLLAAAWARGLLLRHVDWRGNRLRVLRGTRLVPATRKLPRRQEEALV